MLPNLNKVKGLHPGLILKRELQNAGIKGSELAKSVNEHKQTISAILNLKRNITPLLSIKLAKIFKVESDYFMQLQACYEIKKTEEMLNATLTPNLNKFRKVIFWDSQIDQIDWTKNKRAVIKRVFERGNEIEIEEIISFYGKKTIKKELETINSQRLPSFKENLIKYHLIKK